jgi:thymidylate synthase (FAD)
MSGRVQVLDHGYIEKIEHWGSDERIIEAARMSVGDKGFLGWEPGPCPICQSLVTMAEHRLPAPGCVGCDGKGTIRGDKHLLKFLYDMRHATPFEMAGLVIETMIPIAAIREWHRHRTQSYNEMSARYVPLPDVNYVPSAERCMMVNGQNRQAGAIKGANELTHESALEWLVELAESYEHAERVYQSGLERGIPKEVARLPVPVGRYTRMRASANLRNWLAFLTLRSDDVVSGKAAQWEIRQYANEVSNIVKDTFPRTHQLFVGQST